LQQERFFMSSQRVLPVILSGGSGTRLWPMSRTACPKQFIALIGAETMLQLTVERVADPELFEPPMIVAHPLHADLIEGQLGAAATLILEPHARNTAPAIALAALAAPAEQLLLVMPSDHLIHDADGFRAAVQTAAATAAEGWLVTFGVRPSRPETAYGYLRRGAELAPGVFEGEAFVEKPDRETAGRYLADGCYDWNAGIFMFRADVYLQALEKAAPEISAAARAAFESGRREGARVLPDPDSFARSPSDSIDYAVMEKAERFAVVPVDMDWSDVGSWEALHEVSPQDERGTAIGGDVLSIDSKGCLLRSSGPKLVVVGAEDLIVIATADAVLVVPKSQSQRVKEAVDALRAAGGNEGLGV
jgi:mannose-1-phosphate guanylyltransferase